MLCEDNHLLGLYKPAGLLVQGDRTGDASLLDLAKLWLKERYGKPGRVFLGLVHRLDRPVAGAVLFARTSKAASRLSEQFRRGTAEKTYLAVVEGKMAEPRGRLVHFVERGEGSSRIVPASWARGREARLRYRVLEEAGGRSLVEVLLETGRRHQIRLQLAHAGCPVAGDLRYGAASPLPGRQVALLAWRLRVEHPVRREPVLLESPRPRGWPWPGEDEEAWGVPWDWKELRPSLRLPCSSKRFVKE